MDPNAAVLLLSTAIQQAVELIDTLMTFRRGTSTTGAAQPGLPAAAKRALAFALSLVVAFTCTSALPKLLDINGFVANLIWAIALSAGTDGVNSILKYLTYTKENKKATAAKTLQNTTRSAITTVERGAVSTFSAAGPSREDRVVGTVERWCQVTVLDTRTMLETLWLGGPHNAIDFKTAGLLLLCADLASEFRGELDLHNLTPSKFKASGGAIDTVDDLIVEVSRA